jgi:hypothetical protein
MRMCNVILSYKFCWDGKDTQLTKVADLPIMNFYELVSYLQMNAVLYFVYNVKIYVSTSS